MAVLSSLCHWHVYCSPGGRRAHPGIFYTSPATRPRCSSAGNLGTEVDTTLPILVIRRPSTRPTAPQERWTYKRTSCIWPLYTCFYRGRTHAAKAQAKRPDQTQSSANSSSRVMPADPVLSPTLPPPPAPSTPTAWVTTPGPPSAAWMPARDKGFVRSPFETAFVRGDASTTPAFAGGSVDGCSGEGAVHCRAGHRR